MEEVTKQLKPTNELLSKIDKWKLSLWSNGSGGPPGYLEIARKEDDERYSRLFTNIEDLGEHKSTVEKFLLLFEEREEQRKKSIQRWTGMCWKIGAPIGTALLSLSLWIAHQSIPVVRVLWEEYLKAHPQVTQQINQMSQTEVGSPVQKER